MNNQDTQEQKPEKKGQIHPYLSIVIIIAAALIGAGIFYYLYTID